MPQKPPHSGQMPLKSEKNHSFEKTAGTLNGFASYREPFGIASIDTVESISSRYRSKKSLTRVGTLGAPEFP